MEISVIEGHEYDGVAALDLALGLILLIAEVFVPSGGLIGLLAVCCVCVSLWQAFHQSYDLGSSSCSPTCFWRPWR